jgi:integrase
MSRKSATHLLPSSDRTLEWDAKVPGLFKRIGARGSVFYVFYRNRSGTQRKLKLGDARVLGLEPARKRALEVLGQVARGEDPAVRDKPTDYTLEELRDAYMKYHASKRQKPSGQEYTKRIWELHILPNLVTKPPKTLTGEGESLTGRGKPLTVRQVSVTHCMDLHHKLRHKPFMANRVLEVIHTAYNLAIKMKWVDENPAQVDAYPEPQRRRKPTPEEAIRLFSALNVMRPQEPHFVALIELLALTGCRRNEIMHARWEWVGEDGMHIPDSASKTGQRIVALNAHAREILDALPREAGNPHIIVGRRPGAHLVSPKGLWKRLLKDAKITGLRMHDLRRYFAAAGIAGGLTLEQVGQLLGHTQAQTTRRYAWLLTGAATAAAEVVATQIKRTPH